MIKMHSQRRSLSAALDMVEAAISSLENQAKQAKQFEEQQQQQLLQARLAPLLPPDGHEHLSPKEHIINYKLSNKPMDKLQSQLSVTHNSNSGQAKLSHSENFNLRDTSKNINYKVVGSTAHKKHKSGKKVRAILPGVLLQQRSSTPRKRSSSKRSGGTGRSKGKQHGVRNRLAGSPVTTERNNNSIIQAEDKEDAADVDRDLMSIGGKQHRSGYLQPTLSSKRREQLTDKPKKKKSSLPFVPVGSEGKSYHVGVIIQKELGKLKSQPLEVWAAAKHNAAKREAAAAP